MRLLAAGLLVAALVLLPTASANKTSIGLSGPGALVDLTSNATALIPVTVSFHIDEPYTCTGDQTVTIPLTMNSSGPITASLDATSVKFTVPGTANIGGVPATPQAYNSQKQVNLTVNRTAAGNGTITLSATFNGQLDCTAEPEVGVPPTGSFESSSKTLNITTQALGGTTPTPTTTTTTTPTGTTPTSTTPVSSSPVSTSPTGETTPTPTTTEEENKGFLGVPGPGLPLLVAGLVAALVLLRRR